MSWSVAVRGAFMALVGTCVYLNSLSGPFLFDDQSSIVSNPRIRALWPPMDALAPLSTGALASRPLVNLSFAMNHAVGGLEVRGYHIANVVIHVAASFVLFLLVRLALTAPTLRHRFLAHADGIAMTVALIWMVHPIQTEAVDYLTQRTELLMGFFYLLTVFCAVRALRSTRPDHWHLAAVVSCLIGAGAKESIATAPIMVLLYDRLIAFASLRQAVRDRRALYAGLALSWVQIAAMLSSRNNTAGFGAGVSLWTYLLNQAVMVTQYLKLTVWPYSLVVDYGAPRSLNLIDVLPQAGFIIALLALTVAALAWKPMVGFWAAWVFVTLAPTSSFIPIATEVGAERRMYLPLAGIVVLAVTCLYTVIANLRVTFVRPAMTVMVGGIVVWLSAGTMQRNREYASATSVLETSVSRWPHGRSRFNLAHALRSDGRREEATAQLRAAVSDNPQAQYVLASDLYDRGQFDDAVVELRSFAGRKGVSTTDAVAARNLIGLAMAQQGYLDSAVAELQAALAIEPDNPDLHANLAFLFLRLRQFERARHHYNAYLSRRQGNAFILTSLGTVLAELGQVDDAAKAYRDALAIDSGYAEAAVRLSELDTRARIRVAHSK